MPNAVQNDLGDRALAILVLVAGLIIDRAREAVERLRPCALAALEDEGCGSRIRAARERNLGIDLQRLLGRDILKDQRRWGRGCGMAVCPKIL